jgi:hypothetical protein
MHWAGYEPPNPESERSKTFRASDPTTTLIGVQSLWLNLFFIHICSSGPIFRNITIYSVLSEANWSTLCYGYRLFSGSLRKTRPTFVFTLITDPETRLPLSTRFTGDAWTMQNVCMKSISLSFLETIWCLQHNFVSWIAVRSMNNFVFPHQNACLLTFCEIDVVSPCLWTISIVRFLSIDHDVSETGSVSVLRWM